VIIGRVADRARGSRLRAILPRQPREVNGNEGIPQAVHQGLVAGSDCRWPRSSGVHEIDDALWVMDAKEPRSVMASGGKVGYPDDASETPDTLQAATVPDGSAAALAVRGRPGARLSHAEPRRGDPQGGASTLACGLESGSVAAINAHMGNVAFEVGRKVYWGSVAGSFEGDAEANAVLVRRYHNGWALPRS
jgi:hypothetical protein